MVKTLKKGRKIEKVLGGTCTLCEEVITAEQHELIMLGSGDHGIHCPNCDELIPITKVSLDVLLPPEKPKEVKQEEDDKPKRYKVTNWGDTIVTCKVDKDRIHTVVDVRGYTHLVLIHAHSDNLSKLVNVMEKVSRMDTEWYNVKNHTPLRSTFVSRTLSYLADSWNLKYVEEGKD